MGCPTPGKNTNCCGKTVTETQTKVTEYGTDYCKMPKGTLQYTGARYVPVFANPVEWSADRTYEHLMMVQHMGATYISRQAVPVGAQLPAEGEQSNDYWVFLTNWNAQIEQYRQDVEAVENDVETLSGRTDAAEQNIESLTGRADTAEQNIGSLTGRVDAAEQDIDSLTERTTDLEVITASLNKYKGGVYVSIGDSIAKGRYVLENEAFPAVCANLIGATLKNFAVNSAAYTRESNPSLYLYNQAVNAVGDTSFDNDDVKLVTIAAGVNDALTELATASQIVTQAAKIANYLKANFKNADIVFLNFPQGIGGLGNYTGNKTHPEVYRGISLAAARCGCRCINTVYSWGTGQTAFFESTGPSPWGDTVNADALHPNVLGNERYGQFLATSLAGADYKPTLQRAAMKIADNSVDGDNWRVTNSNVVCIDGMIQLSGYLRYAGSSNSIQDLYIELPTMAAPAVTSTLQWYHAIYAPDSGSRDLKLLWCAWAVTQPGGQDMGSVKLRVRAPSGGFEPESVVKLPLLTFPIGQLIN